MGYNAIKSQAVIDAFRCPDDLGLFSVPEDLSKRRATFASEQTQFRMGVVAVRRRRILGISV